jgi:outer membrane protein OmpA-like peptidoglycan-associated protein
MLMFSRIFTILLTAAMSAALTANDVCTGGQTGVVRALSASTLGKTGLHAGGAFMGAAQTDYVAGPGGSGEVELISGNGSREAVNGRTMPLLLSGDIYCAYGLFPFLDISIDMPFYYDKTGWENNVAGAGDLEVAAKMAYPFQKDDAFFTHAYYLKAIFPTGQTDRGYFPRHAYYLQEGDNAAPYTADAVLFNPMLVWTLDFAKLSPKAPFQLDFNFGGVIARKKSSSVLSAAVALSYTPASPVTLFVEVSGESRVRYYTEYFDEKAMNNDPLRLSPGVRLNLPHGFYATLAGDIGLSENSTAVRTAWERNQAAYSTYAIPRYGAQILLGWSAILHEDDRDNDGIIDKKDACPLEAEDRDNFKDDDGCPDNDNDNDGIVDSQDRCPDSAGTDGGCPVYDADGDEIKDAVDKCAHAAEDVDGFEDLDGCPDPDNDNDGVVDAKDACPAKAEDLDGFEDGDGCPDLDNDGDGVADAEDKCPGVRGLPDNGGCPKTKEISRGKLILNGVTFTPGKAVLTTNSYTILDNVYESLAEWKEVKLEIQGHTDNMGNSMTNLKLSQLRADAVKAYLMRKGIAGDRLRSVGYGEEFPIADNNTADGREKNRRVELRRID